MGLGRDKQMVAPNQIIFMSHSHVDGCVNIHFFLSMAGLEEGGVWEGGMGVLKRLVRPGEG